MLPISSSTLLLIERLYAAVDHAPSRAAASQCLEELRRSAETGAIPKLVPLLMTARGRFQEEVAATIAALLARVRPRLWPGLDRSLRGQSWMEHEGGQIWHHLDSGLPWIEPLRRHAVPMLTLVCCHGNGFLRAIAMKKLAETDRAASLPILLLRSFDWVPAIRQLARQLIEPLLTEGRFVEILLHLPLIRSFERSAPDIATWRSRLHRYLETKASPAAIATGCHSREPLVRRVSFTLALGRSARPRRLLLEAAEDPDPVIQHWAIRQASHTLDDSERQAFLGSVIDSRFPFIRRRALDLFAQYAPEQAIEPLRTALTSRSGALRSTARRHLSRLAPMSFREYYRERIETRPLDPEVAAIAGLGETGEGEDADRIVRWTEHPRMRVRRVAYGALARLAPEKYREVLLRGLSDPSRSICRLIYRIARLRPSLFSHKELWGIFRESAEPHARLAALRLLLEKDRWVSLHYLLPASADSDLEVAETAQQMLQSWCDDYNRFASVPTPEQIRKLEQKLHAFGWALEPSTRDTIRFCLESWPT
ncbi:MAG: hypothetical protein RL885_23660 [Planctomycetota bacterium]